MSVCCQLEGRLDIHAVPSLSQRSSSGPRGRPYRAAKRWRPLHRTCPGGVAIIMHGDHKPTAMSISRSRDFGSNWGQDLVCCEKYEDVLTKKITESSGWQLLRFQKTLNFVSNRSSIKWVSLAVPVLPKYLLP